MTPSDSIFVAGHSGMVGTAIVKRLKQDGFLNILSASRQDLDLRRKPEVMGFFGTHRPKFVFLAAARVGGIGANIREPVEFLVENLEIHVNLLEGARNAGATRVLILGSSCAYPRECPQPMKEEYLMTGPLEPTNEGYALSKIVALRLGQYYAKEYGFECVSIMPPNLYGPGDKFDLEKAHVLSSLVKRFVDAADSGLKEVSLWGTGTARREFMHVDDAADACIHFMREGRPGEFYNVGWGTDVSIKELAEKIAAATGYSGGLRWDASKPDGMPRKCLDVGVMKQMGFQPRIPLERGIQEMVVLYREHRRKGNK